MAAVTSRENSLYNMIDMHVMFIRMNETVHILDEWSDNLHSLPAQEYQFSFCQVSIHSSAKGAIVQERTVNCCPMSCASVQI